jgi:tetratricopeptide (TPR) repeat protein
LIDRSSHQKNAMDAYRRGALEEAIALQRRTARAEDPDQRPEAGDFLLLGLFLYANKQPADAAAALRDGLRFYPDSPEIHENLGICLLAADEVAAGVEGLQRALALGSISTNALDGLCRGLARLGRNAEAVACGRRSLELKDARFGAAPALCGVPDAPPPEFNPRNPAENVIAYALWGADQRYLAPLAENMRIRKHLFPAWTIRVYLDQTVPQEYRLKLERDGAQICLKQAQDGEFPHRKLLWRFEVIADPGVKRFLVRDADSLLNVKERMAVDDWTRSAKYFHLMRDYLTHTDLVLAGLWGGVSRVLPPLPTLLAAFKPWRVENDHVDQDLLTVTAWPTIRQSCLIHDSVFTGSLGSVPFPPYGDLPAGHHIGQNAFIHFRRQDGAKDRRGPL